MVKVQKPSPKTLQQDSSKKSKNIQIKKLKVTQTKPLTSSSTISRNEKTKLVKEIVKPRNEKNVTKDKASMDTKKHLPKDIKLENRKKPSNAKPVEVANKKQSKQKKPKSTQPNEKIVNDAQKQSASESLGKAQKRKAVIKDLKNDKKKMRADVVEKTNQTTSQMHFEAVAFDEKKFKDIVNLKNIKKVGDALKVLVEKEVNEKKTSIFSDYRYFLNVCSYKIPNCPKRMVKLNLKHSLVDPNTDDVVIIVPDLQRGAKVDYEPTIQHYQDLFRDKGVTNLKIVPFNQLRNECTTFESKRKFASTYDYFLCDGRIVSHVVGFCGKHFQKPRTTFHAVRLNNSKTYKSDIQHALKRTSFKQLEKGDLISIPVGNHRFNIDQLAENVEFVVKQLKTVFPGGYANIRNMHMRIDIKGTSSMPLYINLAGAPPETPNVIGLREKRMLKLKKEANDILSKFSLSKTGEFVKLTNTQVQRKQKMREAKESLSKKAIEDSNDNDEVGHCNSQKLRKDKKDLEKFNASNVNQDNDKDVPENNVKSSKEDSEDDDEEDSENDNDEEQLSENAENESDDDDDVDDDADVDDDDDVEDDDDDDDDNDSVEDEDNDDLEDD